MSDMRLEAKEEFEPLPTGLRSFRPEWGVVLGSGLGDVLREVDLTLVVPYEDIPDLPVSSVSGHAGQLALGRIGSTSVALAQGRVHLYEGRTAEEVTAGVRLLGKLGLRKIVLTNAAGAVNRAFQPGTWMMINDHLNLTGTSPLLGGATFLDMSEAYSQTLRTRFAAAAVREGIALSEGVYAGLPGPQYETPAEVRMLQRLGADAVGMSTVLETIQARALGMEVVAFSCLTNWAAGLGGAPLDHSEVLATGRSASAEFIRLLNAAVST